MIRKTIVLTMMMALCLADAKSYAKTEFSRSNLAAPGRGSVLSKQLSFRNATASSRIIKIDLEGPLPKFNHDILMGIEHAYPRGFTTPMEAWEALGLYAQQGTANWLISICLSPRDGRWRLIPLGRSNSKGEMKVSFHNLTETAKKLETRMTLVRTMAYLGLDSEQWEIVKKNVFLEKVPAPFCPPDLHDILNQMKPLLLEDYGKEKNLTQLETAYYVTPAGIFSVTVHRSSKIYKSLCKKKYGRLETAIDAMYVLPDSMIPFVSEARRLTAHELSGWYSEKAWTQFLSGNQTKLRKEYASKKACLEDYKKLLAKNGIYMNFVPFHSQEIFLNQW